MRWSPPRAAVRRWVLRREAAKLRSDEREGKQEFSRTRTQGRATPSPACLPACLLLGISRNGGGKVTGDGACGGSV